MIWTIYLVLIALAMPMVLLWTFDAAVFAGVMLAAILVAHLVLRERVCLDCGEQWRP